MRMVRVYNSNENVVFYGTMEEFDQFPLNDSDRVEIIKEGEWR